MHLGLFQPHPIAFQRAKHLFDAPAQGYNRTISHAASASPTSRLVNRRQCSGSWFAGGSISRASTRVIDTVAASVLANPWRGRLRVTGPARKATVATRPGSPTRRGATLTWS